VAAARREALLTSRPCTVLIARPEAVASLERHARIGTADLVALTDAEPLRALEIITTRVPTLVVVDRVFAETPRGAALVNRLRADPALADTEIRVIPPDEPPPAPPAGAGAQIPARPKELDRRGTRRAERVTIVGEVEVLVDGNPAALVDVSTIGAQVVSPTVLRPNQRVRVAIPDDRGTIRCAGVVAWAEFEIPTGSGPRYRAGVEFFNGDAAALDALCARHRPPSTA
jgi:hypothetical protein